MATNYREVPGRYPGDADRYAEGISRVNNLVYSLQIQGLLPEEFSESGNSQEDP